MLYQLDSNQETNEVENEKYMPPPTAPSLHDVKSRKKVLRQNKGCVISFSEEDMTPAISTPTHENTIVINVKLDRFDKKIILVYDRISTNILFLDTFTSKSHNKKKLNK